MSQQLVWNLQHSTQRVLNALISTINHYHIPLPHHLVPLHHHAKRLIFQGFFQSHFPYY